MPGAGTPLGGKVAVLGLDGVSLDLIISLVGEGYLPTFRKILEEGVHGVLRSTIPPISPVAWTSIATGLNPGKHGVFGFVDRHLRPHSSWNLRGKALWDLASASGRKVICLNVPFTYPPYPVRGLMVSGPPCPRDKARTYPHGLAKELEGIGYKVDIRLPGEEYRGLEEEVFLEEAEEVTRLRIEALSYLMEKTAWDLLYVVFTTPDRVQHVFFGRAFRGSPLYDERGRSALVGYFRLLDDLLGGLLPELEDAVVFLVSDHGFEPLYRYVGLQNLVSGFLARRKPLRALYDIPLRLMGKLGLIKLMKEALGHLGLLSAARRRAGGGLECGMGYIYSNDPSLDLRELARYLTAIRDEGGRRVIERVYLKEELYHGPFLKEAPDLVVVPGEGYEVKGFLVEGFSDVRPVKGMIYKTGTHMGLKARSGFLAILGPGVKRGMRLDADVYDIAPTVLHVLGLPIPKGVDGRVLTDAYEEGGELARRPARMGLSTRETLALRVKRIRAAIRYRRKEA